MEAKAMKTEGATQASQSEPSSEHITIKVQSQDGSTVSFKIKKHTAFKKLMVAYCGKANLSMHAVRFCFDEERVTETATPFSMGMEDGDMIEVFQEQSGGLHHHHNHCRYCSR